MPQQTVQQEQQPKTEQTTEIKDQTTPKPSTKIKLKQPTLQDVLKNNRTKIHDRNHQKPPQPPPPLNTPSTEKPTTSGNENTTTSGNNKRKNSTTKKTTGKMSTPKNKKITKGKNNSDNKTVQQLRGFWTAFAKKQKERSVQEQERKLTHTKTSEPVHSESASSFIFESIPKPTPITGEPESKLLEHSISQNEKIRKNENGKLDLELPKLD